jgi:hypothetical protein
MGFGDWADQCPDVITIEPFVSRTSWGDVTYGAAVRYPAHVQGKLKTVRTRDNVDAVSNVQVYIGPTPAVGPDDRITLPTDYAVASPPILAVSPVRDEDGPHHQVIFC